MERICSQRERILSFKSSSSWHGNNLYHIRWPPLNVTIFIMHVRNCVMGATPMKWTNKGRTTALKQTTAYTTDEVWGLDAFYWQQILALDYVIVKTQQLLSWN